MSATISAIPPKKEAQLNRYCNFLPAPERRYGFALLSWLKGGGIGHEPGYEYPRMSHKRARHIKVHIYAMSPWEEAES